MKIVRRLIFGVALFIVFGCIVLLATNYDPSNPTHRRYSSEVVIIEGNDKTKGDDGERILSKDLNVTINDSEEGKGYCLCHKDEDTTAAGSRCKVCLVDLPLSGNAKHRIPDFVTDNYIADSKNRFSIIKLEPQMNDFIAGATKLELPLWIYVRVNSKVDPEVEKAIATTGGRIVYYFAIPNYVDPMDVNLIITIIGAFILIATITVLEKIAKSFTFALPTMRQPKSSVVVPEHKTSHKARQSVDDSERFMRDAGDNARHILDE